MVLGIPTTQLFSHVLVRSFPETAQILCDLHRSLGRREQMQHHRYVSAGNSRCFLTAEHLLQPDSEDWWTGQAVVQGKA